MKRFLLALTIPAALILTGCSSSESTTDGEASSTTASASTTQSTTSSTVANSKTGEPTASTDIYEVTADGLTTAVNVPVTASTEEMAQGCAEAKAMLDAFGGDAEVALALIQATAEDSTEGFTVTTGDNPWAAATPQEQAAIIASLRAAENGEC